MVVNIKEIRLWTEEDTKKSSKPHYNKVPPVKIEFNYPCSWTTLNIEDLKQILREWIKGEEQAYPQPQFKGRWLLFEEIKKVFDEKPSNSDIIQLNPMSRTGQSSLTLHNLGQPQSI